MSLLKRFRMRPAGVVSKKDIGARMIRSIAKEIRALQEIRVKTLKCNVQTKQHKYHSLSTENSAMNGAGAPQLCPNESDRMDNIEDSSEREDEPVDAHVEQLYREDRGRRCLTTAGC